MAENFEQEGQVPRLTFLEERANIEVPKSV